MIIPLYKVYHISPAFATQISKRILHFSEFQGGESFKASLALALGLSDENQSSADGVHLDIMFIDEGFGTLDDDSLHLAIAALKELIDCNRLVGIISHMVN
ncbi:MAG: hypothetical protein IJD75_06060 [Clostridia bacterium]|nr:hypothetical protein [Clostridia bacterium]MBQ3014679.1 hypothetical protein [Clostridia bacterium]